MILKIASKLKASKGCGLDGISVKIIKIFCQSPVINFQVNLGKEQELSQFISQEIKKMWTTIDQYQS